MLQSKKCTPPKLRAKAAQVRGLVAYAPFAADIYLTTDVERGSVEGTAKAMATQLATCYTCLTPDGFAHAKLSEHCHRYCILAVVMEGKHNATEWRCKPKLHMFEELAEYQTDCPS
eukprot:16435311-Heterocapsa_arctica.AAC.1